jgi:hypothetical protein
VLVLALGMASAACNNGSSSSTTSATVPLTSETLPGVVPAPINSVLQSANVFFTVGAPGGTVTVTLTSAVQTNPDGTANPSVVMGVAVGTASGTTCSLGVNNLPVLMQASATSTLSGTANPGAFCVQVSDVTNQSGPVAFTIVVTHP